VSSSFFNEIYFAPRPPSERLVNKKLELRSMNIMRDWKTALSEYIHDYYTDYLQEKNISLIKEKVTL
jgi:dTDP-4-dehydrorhamnose reductase